MELWLHPTKVSPLYSLRSSSRMLAKRWSRKRRSRSRWSWRRSKGNKSCWRHEIATEGGEKKAANSRSETPVLHLSTILRTNEEGFMEAQMSTKEMKSQRVHYNQPFRQWRTRWKFELEQVSKPSLQLLWQGAKINWDVPNFEYMFQHLCWRDWNKMRQSLSHIRVGKESCRIWMKIPCVTTTR